MGPLPSPDCLFLFSVNLDLQLRSFFKKFPSRNKWQKCILKFLFTKINEAPVLLFLHKFYLTLADSEPFKGALKNSRSGNQHTACEKYH